MRHESAIDSMAAEEEEAEEEAEEEKLEIRRQCKTTRLYTSSFSVLCSEYRVVFSSTSFDLDISYCYRPVICDAL